MKKTFFSVASLICFLSSCSYDPGTTNNPTATMKFKVGFDARYDITIVDTAKTGNNPDHLTDSVRRNIEEKNINTVTSITDKRNVTKNNVAYALTFINAPGPGIPQDSDYLYQDPNGDLYRYNFGFNILNQFPYLVSAIGSNVDVGWVLVAKMTSATGATWVAQTDTVTLQINQLPVYLLSQGEMMADTTFIIGSETIHARHARNKVTATAVGNSEQAVVYIDSYYSTDINAVVCDFFRHVALSGTIFNQQAQGKFKIMTSHN